MKNIVAVILAGGKSTRFWPLADKNLIDFTQGNLLEYHLRTLAKIGIKDFIVVCSSEVAAFLRVNGKHYNGITIHRVLQNESNRGIGKAVLLASAVLEKYYSKRPIYVLNSNDLYDGQVHLDLYRHWYKNNSFMSVVAYQVTTHKPFGYFKIAQDKVKGIIEKPSPDKIPSNLTNMALHLYSDHKELTKIIKEKSLEPDQNDDLYERSINILCQKYDVSYITYKGQWEILKYPWNILNVSNYFLSSLKNKIADNALVDKTAKITGPIVIEDNVKILEFARILGPAVIKKGTIVGTGSFIRESIIGKNCVLGYHSEVTRSYVGNNCWFHTNYIGDSVLGNEVNIGSGAVLANLRLDQKAIHSDVKGEKLNTGKTKFGVIAGNGAQIGVNVSTMPGVKIGKNAVVGPGVVLKEDVEDNTSIFLNQQLVKKKANTLDSSPSRKHFRDLLKI